MNIESIDLAAVRLCVTNYQASLDSLAREGNQERELIRKNRKNEEVASDLERYSAQQAERTNEITRELLRNIDRLQE